MAAITTAVVAGAGLLLTVYGQQQAKEANQHAADLNAEQMEKNAQLTAQQNAEDARQFRMTFRRDAAQNVVNIGASGIKLEGSPMEALQDNAASAERDYQNIKAVGQQQAMAYRRQGQIYRETGAANSRAADIGSAASLLSGSASVYTTGTKSGAWS